MEKNSKKPRTRSELNLSTSTPSATLPFQNQSANLSIPKETCESLFTLKQKAIQTKGPALQKYKQLLSQNLINLILSPDSPRPGKSSKPMQAKIVLKAQKDAEADLRALVTPSDSEPGPIPCELSSFKFICELNSLKPLPLQIPETFIFGHGFESPAFLYNDAKGIQVISKLNTKSSSLLSLIFAKMMKNKARTVPPIVISRTYNSFFNKILLRLKDLKPEVRNGFKRETCIQRYVVSKGNMTSKVRVVFKDDQVRVFRITNRIRCDKQSLEEEVSVKLPKILLEKKEKPRISTKASFSSNKDPHEHSLAEFLAGISAENVPEDLEFLISCLKKFDEKSFEDDSDIHDEVNSLSFSNQLRKMFCTYSSNSQDTMITELKSLNNFKKLTQTFLTLKDSINSLVLLKQNKKISNFICDFFEDSCKNLYFSQIKYCKCVESLHIPLKIVMKKNKHSFKCPGKYCNSSVNSNQVEVFAESILMPSKKVFPKKCKILVGTISDEKFESADNMQKLNPRLFERTQVCKNCFQVYSEKLAQGSDCKKSLKQTQGSAEFDEIFHDEPRVNIRKNFSYMGKLGVKLFTFTKQQMMKKEKSFKVVRQKKAVSFFDEMREDIDQFLKFEEFVE